MKVKVMMMMIMIVGEIEGGGRVGQKPEERSKA